VVPTRNSSNTQQPIIKMEEELEEKDEKKEILNHYLEMFSQKDISNIFSDNYMGICISAIKFSCSYGDVLLTHLILTRSRSFIQPEAYQRFLTIGLMATNYSLERDTSELLSFLLNNYEISSYDIVASISVSIIQKNEKNTEILLNKKVDIDEIENYLSQLFVRYDENRKFIMKFYLKKLAEQFIKKHLIRVNERKLTGRIEILKGVSRDIRFFLLKYL